MANVPPLEPCGLALVRTVQCRHPKVESATLPYRFDVPALAAITHAPLLEHIKRVGQVIDPETSR